MSILSRLKGKRSTRLAPTVKKRRPSCAPRKPSLPAPAFRAVLTFARLNPVNRDPLPNPTTTTGEDHEETRTGSARLSGALDRRSGARNGRGSQVTELGVSNPTTGLYVGNSYSFYNCGVHGYVRGLTRAANRTWKARLQTISSGMLSWHNVEDYLLPHEMDTYVVKGTDKMFDVVFLQGMSSEPIAAKRVPTFRKYLAKHVETIRSKSSVPVVVVTWAKADKMDKDTRRLADSIIEEANRNNAIALPVGLAFAESLKERPDLVLHQADKSHPTAAGSYLYGALIYSLLFKASPEGLDFLGECEKPLRPEDAAYLQKLAWRVATEFYGWK